MLKETKRTKKRRTDWGEKKRLKIEEEGKNNGEREKYSEQRRQRKKS